MKFAVSTMLLLAAAIGLAGCGSSMRNLLERDGPPPQQTAVRQDLTMPPDLQLAPPGTAPAATSQPLAPTDTTSNYDQPTVTAARPAPEDDIYARAGISLYRADGTKKSDEELRTELRAYYIAQKQKKNPNYGTVFNIGNIFKDE